MVYMVAVIEDNMDNIIGMRLIDIKYKQLVDAPLDGIIKGIINGTKIENIKIENGQLIGSNGGIDRYTRVNSAGQVKGGKTPFVVLSQVRKNGDSIGVNIVDYRGNISRLSNRDSVRYASNSNKGVANGRVYRHHIVPLVGKYPYLELEEVHEKDTKTPTKQSRRATKYTGELIGEPLKPIYFIDYAGPIIYNFKDGRIEKKNINIRDNNIGDIPSIEYTSMRQNQYGIVEDCQYTIAGNKGDKIDNTDQDTVKLLMEFRENREVVDTEVKKNTEAGTGKKLGGIILRLGVYPERIGLTTDSKVIEEYYNKIKAYNAYIYIQSDLQEINNIVAYRTVYGTGIRYKVLTREFSRSPFKEKTYTLEEIYADKDKYKNIRKTDKGIAILGLDGEYEYDMDKIHNTYRRKVQTNESATRKAEVLGYEVKEVVSTDGRLITYKNESATVIDLSKPHIRKIEKNSIELHRNNKKIVFGSQLKSVSKEIFGERYYRGSHRGIEIDEVEIYCGEIPSIGAIESVIMLRNKTKLKFNREITTREFLTIIGLHSFIASNRANSIQAKNINTNDAIWDEQLILGAVQEKIKLTEDIINRSEGKRNYDKIVADKLVELGTYWETILRDKCGSNQTRIRMDNVINQYKNSKK